MNNRFKFRAWNKKTKKMVDLAAITPLALDYNFKQDGVFIPFSEDYVIQQFTGLRDKTGREIYEGDVMTYWERTAREESNWVNYPAVFHNGAFYLKGWYNRYKNDYDYIFLTLYKNTPYEGKVVGNIFENPELLESNGN